MAVYLIHLDEPLGSERHHAQHYLGETDNLPRRLAEHRGGYPCSAAILRAAVQRGITLTLARTWDGGRETEHQLKRRHNSRQLCPICAANSATPDGIAPARAEL